ncbi:MAG: DUF948 domain-containing protein [Actinomycetota bacterium]
MTLGQVAGLIAALAFAGLVVFISLTLMRVQGLLLSTQDLLKDVQRTAVPVLEEVRQTVATLNVELDRVDGIMAAAESVSSSVSNVARLVTSAATNPLIKGLSLLAGARAGMRSFGRRGKGKAKDAKE